MFGAAGQILRQIWLARAATAAARHQAGLAVVQCERWASGLAAINDRGLRRPWAGAPGDLRLAEGGGAGIESEKTRRLRGAR